MSATSFSCQSRVLGMQVGFKNRSVTHLFVNRPERFIAFVGTDVTFFINREVEIHNNVILAVQYGYMYIIRT